MRQKGTRSSAPGRLPAAPHPDPARFERCVPLLRIDPHAAAEFQPLPAESVAPFAGAIHSLRRGDDPRPALACATTCARSRGLVGC